MFLQTTKIKWTLLVVVLTFLTKSESQSARSYDTSEWIPITKSPNDDAPPQQKKPSSRVLNISGSSDQRKYYTNENNNRSKQKPPVVEQYLRETTQVAPQRQSGRYQDQPQYYLIPKQREQASYQDQQNNRNPYSKQKNYFIPPLNLTLTNPDALNQELIAILNKPANVQVLSTTPRIKEEKETVQLLYVPVESLPKKEQQPVKHQKHDWSEETRREPQFVAQDQRLQGIQTDFAKQALDAHRLQVQLQAGSVPVVYTTTVRPKRRKPHQPPLALYMSANRDIDVMDVLEELKYAPTIAVQDSIGPDTPKVFVGPSDLDVPNHFAKFELPYLSSIENNRIQRKVDSLPFFVAPLSYKAPPGYSKIPLPSPHVGSVVVSTKEEVSTTKKPVVVEEDEEDSSEEKPVYRYQPKYRKPPKPSEVDDEINRRLEQTENLFVNQASKKQPVNLTVRQRSSSLITPHQETRSSSEAPKPIEDSQEIRVTTESERPAKLVPKHSRFSFEDSQELRHTTESPRPPKLVPKHNKFSFEDSQEVIITTTEQAKQVKPKTYTYSFEEPQEIRVSTQKPARQHSYSFEEPQEIRITTERPARPHTYSFEEPQTSTRPRSYSFEEPQQIQITSERTTRPQIRISSERPHIQEARITTQAATENSRRHPSRTRQYSSEEEAETRSQEDDEEVRRKPPQRSRVKIEESEEPPRRKPARVREDFSPPPPRRESSEEEASPQPRYEASASTPVKESSEESAETFSERRGRPTKVTYDDDLYQATPQRQNSYEETKRPYQINTTPEVYVVQTTEGGYLVQASPEEYRGRASTPKYNEEEPQIYSVTTGRPLVVSQTPKFSPYLNLDIHVKAPNSYEEQKAKSYEEQSGENYNLPPQLPAINPEIPGLINNLQDQSYRQLLVPGLLVPTTENLPVYTRAETTESVEYVSSTTTPEPPTTTQRRSRSRQRGGSRFSLPNSSEEVTATPRRNSQRVRRPYPRQRNNEHENTTPYTPIRVNQQYTTTEATRREITHSPRQRLRSRPTRPVHNSEEETRAPQQPYVQYEQEQSTQIVEHPLQEVSASSKEENKPSGEEQTLRSQESEESTTTVRARSRQRSRSRPRVTATTTTRRPVSATTKPEVKQAEQEEFYGFIRPPSFNKAKLEKPPPPPPTEAPAYVDFDKRFKIPTYSFDFPSYNFPSTQSHDDYYKELEAAGREPIQLYTNDKHLSTTPVYIYKPKYVIQTEDQQNLAATADPAKEEKPKIRMKLPQQRKQEDEKPAERGKAHFQLPAVLRTASEEEEIQGGNYPVEYLQKQASATQSSVFQITVEPKNTEYDQQPFGSVQQASVVLPPENVTEVEKKKSKRRGVWKLVKQRPVDNFETAESQNYHAALQLIDKKKDEAPQKTNLFDTLYEMFSSPENDEASTEATPATTTEEVAATTIQPVTETTILADEISNSTTTTEAGTVLETTMKTLQPFEVAPWEMKAIRTSTTTEVSHETEICFRGRCVKSSGIVETP